MVDDDPRGRGGTVKRLTPPMGPDGRFLYKNVRFSE